MIQRKQAGGMNRREKFLFSLNAGIRPSDTETMRDKRPFPISGKQCLKLVICELCEVAKMFPSV
jgi:hypothetical protein